MLSAGHVNTGHAKWETVWACLRRRCYIPDLAKMCQQYVRACSVCLAANPSHSHSVPKRDVQAEIVPDGQAPSDVAEDDEVYVRVAMVPNTA